MRRWSGLCYGVSAFSTAMGALVGLERLWHASSYLQGRGPVPSHAEMGIALDILARQLPSLALPWCVGGAVLAAIGIVRWLREDIAAKQADAPRAFE